MNNSTEVQTEQHQTIISIRVKGTTYPAPCVIIQNDSYVKQFVEERGFTANQLQQPVDPVTLGILRAKLKPMRDLEHQLKRAYDDIQDVLDSVTGSDDLVLNYTHIVWPINEPTEKREPNMQNKHVSTHISIAIQTRTQEKTPYASIFDNDEVLQFFDRHGFTGKCRNKPVSAETLDSFLSDASPEQPDIRDFTYEVKALLGAVLPGETILLSRTPLTPWDGTGDFREWAG